MATVETKAKEVTQSHLKPETKALADAIAKDIKLGSDGVATVSADLYERTLPEGVTAETVKMIQEHNSRFMAAGLEALGQVSLPAMKKHSDLTRTTLDVALVGKDSMSFSIDRSRQVNAPGGGDAKTVYGYVSASLNIHGASASRGELKKVKQDLAERYRAALGG